MIVLNGFVKIHRKLIQWGWYQDNVVKGVFLHLLLTANFKDTPWQGQIIKAGQVIVGTQKMADELGFTRQQIRTAIKKLKSTNEITTKSTNKYTLVTIINWEDYQTLDEESTNKITNVLTNEQPTNNQRTTNNQPQRKNDKNDKNDKNIYYQLYADMYNEICISFPRLTKLSDKRKKAISARLKSGYTQDDFQTLFTKAEASTFLKGGNNKNWKATFDWLVADGNIAKVLDGNYDSIKKTEPPANKYVNYTQSGDYDMEDIERRILEKQLKGVSDEI